MKTKVLITGNGTNLLSTDTKNAISKIFDINICQPNGNLVKKTMMKFMPQAIVLCVGNDMFANISLYPLFEKFSADDDIPIILVGSKLNCTQFLNTVPSADPFAIIHAPVVTESLKQALMRAVNTSDTMSSETMDYFLSSIAEEEERKKILIVDDDVKVLKLISMYLKDDYDVSIARSGQIAMKFLENNIPDLILLDYVMPEEDGPMVLSYIRSHPLCFATPVFFLTGVSDKESVRKVLGLNVQGYMLKPVKKDELLARIKEFFEYN
jgi:CheY-like chemotaxis protein